LKRSELRLETHTNTEHLEFCHQRADLMAAPQEAPPDNTGKANAAAEMNFDIGFDTEEFSDRVLKLQFENGGKP
jgi:hypothetical protein